ncbi:hypothetical protein CH63R_00064 [Colletotrichum higginsianum IMI 349063]|uniref:Uncharacterized protein n=1 Tax=Colletotrichum higginsianum (strain IMI 349063) TaxID=759273 RepID=A0A1B7YSF2_COLHI|nr:hypothetical protein CH63R_00064 [Colletotrichum higginsianum IMI 349063]OBR14884.1 hypothetical protein CH63R_00064 [Colletotrichum higginsianum IMI 349063]
MSTVNIVKYYFHKANAPRDAERMRKMVLLAYQTAKDKKLYPKEVFIRSEVHLTTTINGVRQQDPKGLHITLCYKDQAQIDSGTHVACHGYVTDKESLQFIEATHAGEKPDSTKKNEKGDVVWPGAERLWAAPEIGYGHLE